MERRAVLRISLRCRSLQRHLPPRQRASLQARSASTQWKKNPLGDYYESLLSQPLANVASATRQPTTPPPPTPKPMTAKEENLAKARVVFGSRLAGPAERAAELKAKSTMIAGVLVPPKPVEPDNCCMSGCVNCVWDRYGEEVEEWAAAQRKANEASRKEKTSETGKTWRRQPAPGTGTASGSGLMLDSTEDGAQHTMVSMDDDGGGSETNWGTGLETDLYKGIPVGILEFMKQEKKLKQKHLREGTKG